MTVYIPLFPAAGPSDPRPGRLLALGFAPRALGERAAGPDLGGPLGCLLGQVRDLCAPVAAPGRGPRCLALEPIPDLTNCAAAGLGLALGLALGGLAPASASAGRRVLACGRLVPGAGTIGVAPLTDPGPLLTLLEGLGAQSQPLLCLLPHPAVPRSGEDRRLAALAGSNLRCHRVDGLPAALRACTAAWGPAGPCPREVST